MGKIKKKNCNLPFHRDAIRCVDSADMHILSSADYALRGTVLKKNKKIRTFQLEAWN
jgi:hypothetical protein